MVVLSLKGSSILPRDEQQPQGRVDHNRRATQNVNFAPLFYHSPSFLHRHGDIESNSSRSSTPLLIATFCEQGRVSAALEALSDLLTPLPVDVYLAILKACDKLQDTRLAKRFYSHILQRQVDITGLLGNRLVETLARCGCIQEALDVFLSAHHRRASTWTLLMSACNQCKQSETTLKLYTLMLEDGVEPDSHTYVSLLKACSTLHNLQEGKKLHAEARAKGVALDVYVNNSLVNMYGKCGDILEAENVFGAMPERNLTSWTSMMSAYVAVGQGEKALQLYRFMFGVKSFPNQHTFSVAIQACCVVLDKRNFNWNSTELVSLMIGQALHADARKRGFMMNAFVSTGLVLMYRKLRKIQEAENVLFSVSYLDTILCNTMLSAYVEYGQGEHALHFFRHMLEQGVPPDSKTFVLAVQACGIFADGEESVIVDGHSRKVKTFELCQAFHNDARRRGFCSNVFLQTTFLGVYAKCGVIEEAEKVFAGLTRPDVVPWTAMMSAYVDQGQEEFALQLFRQMQEDGISPNSQTFVVLVQACASLGDKARDLSEWELPLEIGIALHADARKKGLDSSIFLNTALLGMYGMCGSTHNAELVFNSMPHHDLVAWNAMLNTYVEQDQEKAFQMYRRMLQEGVSPNEKTYVSVLQACGTLMEKGEVTYMPNLVSAFHDDVQKRGLNLDVYISNTLVTIYGIMGYLDKAENTFNALSHHQIVSWNAMLSTYVQHGLGEKALQLYRNMQVEGSTLNDISLVCILQACIQTGNLELCKEIHFSIVSAGNELNLSLASTLIRAYGNCGSMPDAQAVFDSLPLPDVVSWNGCLAGYAGEGNYKLSKETLTGMQVEGIKPDSVTLSSVLSACSHGGFVTQGFWHFESFCRFSGILPESRLISSVIDLVGRAGDLNCLEMIVERLPMHADVTAWLPLLGACCLHGNAELAKQAFSRAVSLQFDGASAFVIMSNIYADVAEGEEF